MLVEYQFEVEADSKADAKVAAESYDYWEDDTAYYGMYSCDVTEEWSDEEGDDE